MGGVLLENQREFIQVELLYQLGLFAWQWGAALLSAQVQLLCMWNGIICTRLTPASSPNCRSSLDRLSNRAPNTAPGGTPGLDLIWRWSAATTA